MNPVLAILSPPGSNDGETNASKVAAASAVTGIVANAVADAVTEAPGGVPGPVLIPTIKEAVFYFHNVTLARKYVRAKWPDWQ